MRTYASRVGVAAAALILVVAGCGDDDDDSSTTTTAPVATDAATSTDPATTETTTSTDPATTEATTSTDPATTDPETIETATTTDPATGAVIDLEVVGGELAGGARRESVPLGEDLTVRVTGDSTDEVHVHGYEVLIPLRDGEGEVTFPAAIPGVFEIELEGSGTLLVRFEVS